MKTTILIIDDDPIFRLMTHKMIQILKKDALEIKECENGRTGIKAFENLNYSAEKVIVFLDINMPILNGWEFLEKLNQILNAKNHLVEVFIVSSSTDKNDENKSKTYKLVKEFLSKPLNIDIISKILSNQ